MGNESEKNQALEDVPFWRSCRLWLVAIAFLGFLSVYAQRVGMSVAIVCMVNHTALAADRHTDNHQDSILDLNGSIYKSSNTSFKNTTDLTTPHENDECILSTSLSSDNHMDGPFTWSKELQGHILGSYFYGYLVSQVPAGLLAERFGGKWVFTIFYFICTVGTLLTPIAAKLHYGCLIAVRALVGIGSGGIFPTTHSIWGQWAPPLERSKLAGMSYTGGVMGNVVGMLAAGILCEHGFGEGWDSIFYVFGIFASVLLFLWVTLVSSKPSTCRPISNKEKRYIIHSLEGQLSKPQKSTTSTPWLSIFTSPPVWAIVVANFTFDWGFYTFLTNIPTYMFEVLKFDIKSNGLFSALPFLGFWVISNLSAIIADKLRSSRLLTTGATRKLFNTIGHGFAAVSLVGLSFLNCSQSTGAVILLILGVSISGSSYVGFLVNHMDIAPKYAGTLIGLTNALAATSGFIAPYVAAVLTPNQTREEWQRVFFIAAAVYTAGALIYLIFASGELQSWALGRENTANPGVMEAAEKQELVVTEEVRAKHDKDC